MLAAGAHQPSAERLQPLLEAQTQSLLLAISFPILPQKQVPATNPKKTGGENTALQDPAVHLETMWPALLECLNTATLN